MWKFFLSTDLIGINFTWSSADFLYVATGEFLNSRTVLATPLSGRRKQPAKFEKVAVPVAPPNGWSRAGAIRPKVYHRTGAKLDI